jgi:protein-S-isoprenylcysteine O-methyltransferase Ste14
MFIILNLATPLILDSPWALITGAIMTILFLIRTALEEKIVRNELEGYKKYS